MTQTKRHEIDKFETKKDYLELIKELENENSSESLHLQAIAYYKLENFEKANSLFESLYKSKPTIEISAFLIICKIKLQQEEEATTLYKQLCKNENKAILNDLKKNNIDNAINRTLFLISIPIKIEKLESTSVEDALEQFDYRSLLKILDKKKKSADQ